MVAIPALPSFLCVALVAVPGGWWLREVQARLLLVGAVHEPGLQIVPQLLPQPLHVRRLTGLDAKGLGLGAQLLRGYVWLAVLPLCKVTLPFCPSALRVMVATLALPSSLKEKSDGGHPCPSFLSKISL